MKIFLNFLLICGVIYGPTTWANESTQEIKLIQTIFVQTSNSYFSTQLADVFALIGFDEKNDAYFIQYNLEKKLFGGVQLGFSLTKIAFDKVKFLNSVAINKKIQFYGLAGKYSKDRKFLGNFYVDISKNVEEVDKVTGQFLKYLKSASPANPTILLVGQNERFEIKAKELSRSAVDLSKNPEATNALSSFEDTIEKTYYYNKWNYTFSIGSKASYLLLCNPKDSYFHIKTKVNLNFMTSEVHQVDFSEGKSLHLNEASISECDQAKKLLAEPDTKISVNLDNKTLTVGDVILKIK